MQLKGTATTVTQHAPFWTLHPRTGTFTSEFTSQSWPDHLGSELTLSSLLLDCSSAEAMGTPAAVLDRLVPSSSDREACRWNTYWGWVAELSTENRNLQIIIFLSFWEEIVGLIIPEKWSWVASWWLANACKCWHNSCLRLKWPGPPRCWETQQNLNPSYNLNNSCQPTPPENSQSAQQQLCRGTPNKAPFKG